LAGIFLSGVFSERLLFLRIQYFGSAWFLASRFNLPISFQHLIFFKSWEINDETQTVLIAKSITISSFFDLCDCAKFWGVNIC